jgi:hypothetical protein
MLKKLQHAQNPSNQQPEGVPALPPFRSGYQLSQTTNQLLPPPYNPNIAPPSYNPNTAPKQTQNTSQQNLESMLYILAQYNIMVILDDSGSMSLDGMTKNVSRWEESLEAISMLLDYGTKFDTDGIEVYFLNNPNELSIMPNQSVLSEIEKYHITPSGATPLGAKLHSVFSRFISVLRECKRKNEHVKPINLIVITDGEPSDKPLVKTAIVNFVRELMSLGYDPSEYAGIQFFQVGTDKNAQAYLQSLDDDLHKEAHIPDIVDCTCFNSNDATPLRYTISKTLLGAVVKSVDNDNYKPH